MENLFEERIKNKLTTFYGGRLGSCKVREFNTIIGKPIKTVDRIEMINPNQQSIKIESEWTFKGISSNLRYTTKKEKTMLDKTPPIIGKHENSFAALIPMSKSEEWWLLTQDERRKIFEEKSDHIKISSNYLETIQRKLFHSRDIGEEFDFLAWFEFEPKNKSVFDDLVGYLRQTEEWKYVIREIDIRVNRD